MNTIADLWRYSEACSHVNPSQYPEFSGYIFTPMKNIDDFGYIAEGPDRIIISFRGTKGTIRAWIENFMVWPLAGDGFFQSGPWGEGTIHKGFYDAWVWFKDPITQYIKNLLKTNPKPNIYCTGHSRGGALSTLCARHIAKNLGIPCSCIGFGSPMVGNSEFRDQYNKLPIYHTRCEMEFDIVPTVPPTSFGFRSVGIPLIFKKPYLLPFTGRWYKSHYYSTYTKGVIAYLPPTDIEDVESIKAMKIVLSRCSI